MRTTGRLSARGGAQASQATPVLGARRAASTRARCSGGSFGQHEGGEESFRLQEDSSTPAPRRGKNRFSEARRARFRRPGPGTAESQSEIRSELNRFQSAFDRFEKEGDKEARWHVVSIAGAKREESYSKRLLEAYEKEIKRNAGQYTLPDGTVQSIELMTPVTRYQYRDVETNRVVKRTVRWPASDVLWCHCVMTARMRAFIQRQTFVRNIFSGEPLVSLSDFAFQDQYEEARRDEEGTLLTFTELLRHARLVECHEIDDPEEVGLDVHAQLTQLFQKQYGGGDGGNEGLAEEEQEEDEQQQWLEDEPLMPM